MNPPSQRATIVIEHVSAIGDYNGESDDDAWYVVAYLISDSGTRERATLHHCKSRSEASAALDKIWDRVIGERARKSSAA